MAFYLFLLKLLLFVDYIILSKLFEYLVKNYIFIFKKRKILTIVFNIKNI